MKVAYLSPFPPVASGVSEYSAELLPELGGMVAGAREDEEHGVRQGRLFEALLTLMERLGRRAPVVLLIEDLHWADGSTRDFITFLVRSAREESLCLVVTYRSDELHRRHPLRPVLAELERVPGVERVALERFDRDVQEQGRKVLEQVEASNRIAILVIGRPYHLDPGLHHGIPDEFQVRGYPILSVRSIRRYD